LRDHFQQVGDVTRAEIAIDGWDDVNGHPFSKGWGIVKFQRPGAAKRALYELDGSRLHGRCIYVKEYIDKYDLEEDDDGYAVYRDS